MSYILDALRKADAERERDPARGIHAQPLPGPSMKGGPSAGYGPWFWAAIAGSVAAVGSVSLYLYRDKPAPTPPVAQANVPVRSAPAPVTAGTVMPAPVVGTTIVPAPVAAPAPAAASIEPPAPPPLPPAPSVPPARSGLAGGRDARGDTRATSQPNPRGSQSGAAVAQLTPAPQPATGVAPQAGLPAATGMPPGSGMTSAPGMPPGASSVPPMQGGAPGMPGGGMAPQVPGAPFTAPSMNPQQAPAAGVVIPPVPAPMPVPPAPPPPINPPPPPPVPPPVLPPAPPTPPVAGLPADAPKLAISGGVYSSSRAQRMLIVNGQVFNEGSEIGPGVVLEEVRAKGAVLRYRGSRYTVNY